jgi:Galactose oxidase, central domain
MIGARRQGALAAAMAACVASIPACGGEIGTIQVSLLAAPGSDLLDRIDRVRVELSQPRTVVEAERGADGELVVDLEIAAVNATGTIALEGFDAAGETIGFARSASLPLAAVNGTISLYVGPPLGFAEAPVALDPARSEVGGALLPFGAILVGGRAGDGDPVDDVVIYNVYDHDFQVGLPLPEERASATVVSGESDLAYVFGGLDADGDASADSWAFNTGVAPSGFFSALVSDGDLARAGAGGVFVSGEQFLVMGAPAVELNGVNGRVSAWPDAPPLADGAAARLETDEPVLLVAGSGVGDSGAVAYRDGEYVDLDAPADVRRSGHAVVSLPDGRGLVVGGAIEGAPVRSAVIYDPSGGELTVRDDFLTAARSEAAITASPEYVIVAGGVDEAGALLADAEVFDADSLEPVASLPLVAPRRGGLALALSNGQVLLVGGVDAEGAPVGTLELFTPAAP